MAKNDFKSFATAANANVTPQDNWETLPALLSGFTAGKASSAQVNKALRQATFIAAALAQYTADKSGQNVLDDGDAAGFIAKMAAAFGKDYQALDATLTALAGLATGANKLPYFTGTDTAGQTDLTQVGRDIIGKASTDAVLQYLGLREASTTRSGTVQLNSATNSSSETLAATPKAVKAAYDKSVEAKNRADSAYNEATRSASTSQVGRVQLNDSISSTSTTQAATPNTVRIAYNEATRSASTSQAGRVQLYDGVASTSTTQAATPNAVKRAYDRASNAFSKNESDDRYIQDIRLGSEYYVSYGNSSAIKPGAGHVYTGLLEQSGDNEIHGYWLRPIQKKIKGTWMNIVEA